MWNFFLFQCFALFTRHPGQSTPLAKPFCSSFTAQEPLRPQKLLSLPTGHSYHSNLGNRPRQTLCSSNKYLRPCQCLFMEVQGCHLPGLKRPCSSVTAQEPLRPQQFVSLPTGHSCHSNLGNRPRQTLCSSNKCLRLCQESFYGGSRLPFARPQTSLQLGHRPGATEATAISVTSHGPLMPQQSR